MMSTTAQKPATTPIPVQLSEPEFEAFILPHLSMPKRGPKCKLGYHRVFNLILWVLYTGMQWKSLPIPQDAHGKPAIHYTTIYKVFAKWADDGSLWQAFMASVAHLAAEKHLDLSVLHGDGTNTVAKKGGWDWVLGLQAPERGEGHRHNRHPWLCVGSPSRGTGQ
jgi:transposase